MTPTPLPLDKNFLQYVLKSGQQLRTEYNEGFFSEKTERSGRIFNERKKMSAEDKKAANAFLTALKNAEAIVGVDGDNIYVGNQEHVDTLKELAKQAKTLKQTLKTHKEKSSELAKFSRRVTQFVKLLGTVIRFGNTRLTKEGQREKLSFRENWKRRRDNLNKPLGGYSRG